jgi:predicted short-subunit dehydrogenase-like oxidoreductase (DUF2520 family)
MDGVMDPAGQKPNPQPNPPLNRRPTLEQQSLTDRPARLRVGVVGAGRVGAVLGAALARAGHRVIAVSAVSSQSQDRAAALLPGVPLLAVPDVVRAAELVLLTVPDDDLPALVQGLADTGTWQAGQIVVHTSGRFGADVLAPARRQNVLALALHPAMTFGGTAVDLERLGGCCFGVTAARPLRPMAEALVVEMGAEPVWVAEADRARYHAALAHGSNHLVTLVAQAAQVLAGAGVPTPSRVLAPLLSAALDGALRAGDAAVTGPVARGDAGTVAAHLRELRGQTPDVLPTYLALARATAVRALAADRLDPDAARELLDVLAEEQP